LAAAKWEKRPQSEKSSTFTGCHDRPEKMALVTLTGRKMRRLISLTYRRLKRPQNYLLIYKI
jgi:hypothetical protein